MKNSNKKIWRILRFALQITIVLGFIGLLAFIIAVIIVHPGCEKVPNQEWWEKSVIYRVELESIKNLLTPGKESAFEGAFKNLFKLIFLNLLLFSSIG